jgi:hypothetical protein
MVPLCDGPILLGHHQRASEELVAMLFLVHDVDLASIASRGLSLVPLVDVSVQNLALRVLGEEHLHPFAPGDQYMQKAEHLHVHFLEVEHPLASLGVLQLIDEFLYSTLNLKHPLEFLILILRFEKFFLDLGVLDQSLLLEGLNQLLVVLLPLLLDDTHLVYGDQHQLDVRF